MLNLWQLPQNILGFIILKITKATHLCKFKDANLYEWNMGGGMSLGKYIFIPSDASMRTIMHEYGHTIQSKYLGWFYLLVIGLPSIIWCGFFDEYRMKHNISYYDFYTEKWADKLGGVSR